MDCSKGLGSLSIDFPEAGELHPAEANFKYGKEVYDSLYCKFDGPTANSVLNDIEIGLNEIQRVVVKINDKPIRSMYYEPQFLKLGNAHRSDQYAGFLELHDLHEHLKKGNVVYAPSTATTEETFTEIYSSRVKEGLFTGLDINSEGDPIEYLPGDDGINVDLGAYNPWNDSESGGIKYNWGIHFDGDSPLEALNEAKNKHGVDTYISPDGELVVGSYKGRNSVTASRVGRESDYHIQSSAFGSASSTLSTVKIRGPEIGEKRIANTPKDRRERLAKFINPYKDPMRHRIHITVNNNSASGNGVKKMQVNNLNPREQNLSKLGKRYYQAADFNANSGRVTINMETSRSNTVPRIGDEFRVKPYSSGCKLESHVDIEGGYLINQANHKFTSDWQVELGLAQPLVSKENLTVDIEVYDLNKEQTYPFEEIYHYDYGQ